MRVSSLSSITFHLAPLARPRSRLAWYYVLTAQWVNADNTKPTTTVAFDLRNNFLVLTGDLAAYNAHASFPASAVVRPSLHLHPPACLVFNWNLLPAVFVYAVALPNRLSWISYGHRPLRVRP